MRIRVKQHPLQLNTRTPQAAAIISQIPLCRRMTMAHSSCGIFQSPPDSWSSGMMADWISGLTYSSRDCDCDCDCCCDCDCDCVACVAAAAPYWFGADCLPRALFHRSSTVFGGSHKKMTGCDVLTSAGSMCQKREPDAAVHQARWHRLSLAHRPSCKLLTYAVATGADWQ